jgi:hypothetical protein
MNTKSEKDLASLYRRAFAEYGARALWNKRELERPTPADALVVARALRVEGDREARRLAEQIERPAVPLSLMVQIHSDDALVESGPMLAPNNSATPAKAGAHRGHGARPSPRNKSVG